MKKYIIALAIINLVALMSSCSANERVTKDVFAMDTFMTLTAYGENADEAVKKASDKISELDSMLSTGNPEGEIGSLNLHKEGDLSESALYILGYAKKINGITHNAFNPLIYPVMKKWGFDTGEYRIPEQKELEECLKHMDMDLIHIDKNKEVDSVSGDAMPEKVHVEYEDSDMQIDLGGIAKGYTSDAIMDIYKECGVTSGIVSLGGNVQALGRKPDGTLWKVAIRHPDNESEQLGIINIEDAAVITSGGYERYFEENGRSYHHIIDPSTGYPAESGLKSVTIISGSGILADALSTAVYVMGMEEAVELWKSMPEEFDMILFTAEGNQFITSGIADNYISENNNIKVIRINA